MDPVYTRWYEGQTFDLDRSVATTQQEHDRTTNNEARSHCYIVADIEAFYRFHLQLLPSPIVASWRFISWWRENPLTQSLQGSFDTVASTLITLLLSHHTLHTFDDSNT